MKNVLNAPFMTEMIRTATNMYNHGWDERNGGNISMLLDEAEVREHLVFPAIVRTIPTGFTAPELDGKIFSARTRKLPDGRWCGFLVPDEIK